MSTAEDAAQLLRRTGNRRADGSRGLRARAGGPHDIALSREESA
ncbi:hypothetical protein [Streptomyces sp. 6N223]